MSYEIIAISEEWDGLPCSCKHLISRFIPQKRVIWIEAIGLRSPGLNIYDLRRSYRKISSWLFRKETPFRQLPANLDIITPPQVPYNQVSAVRRLNQWIMVRDIEKARSKSQAGNRVVISTWPFLAGLIGRLGESLSIYYRVDDFAEFPGVKRQYLQECEREFVSKVDMVVASSDKLTQIEGCRGSVKYLPHGVDFDQFSLASRTDNGSLPIAQIPPPRIGFYGLLSSWVDFGLLASIAERTPEFNYVLLGPSQVPKSSLPKRPNLHYLGPVAYDELPRHAIWFDVAMIPFKVNNLTLAVNPLKFMEYLALGLPVVSTPLPDVAKHGAFGFIAADAEQFIASIKKALTENSEAAIVSRRRCAMENSWEARANQLHLWIEDALARKGNAER